MKSILKSYQQPTLWPFFLAQVVLAVNTHYDHDLQSTPAFRAYGFSLNTPGIPNWVDPDTQRFIIHKRQLTQRKEYISPNWETATHAYIRILQRKHKLAPLYKGPFRIIDRYDRSMLLDVDETNLLPPFIPSAFHTTRRPSSTITSKPLTLYADKDVLIF